MKKFKLLVLGLCLALSLTACGSEEKTLSDYTEEELAELSDEELEELMEAEMERLEAEEKEAKEDKEDKKSGKESKKSAKSAEPMQEILDAQWYSGLIQIGDTLIELPIQFSELLDMGFEYELYAKEHEMDERSKDYLFENGSATAFFYKDGDLMFGASGKSSMEGWHTIEEINPTFSRLELYCTKEYPVYYPRNLKAGDSFTLIEETYGKYSSTSSFSDNVTYYYGGPLADDTGMSVSWNRNTQKITGLSISRDKKVNEELTLEFLTREDVNYGNKVIVDITMKYFPEHNDEMEAWVLKDGQLYQLRLTATGIPPFHWSEPLTEKVYEKSGEDGVYRMIATNYEKGFEYCVYDGNIVIEGYLYVEDFIQDSYPNYVELFLDTAIEIVESISYTNS